MVTESAEILSSEMSNEEIAIKIAEGNNKLVGEFYTKNIGLLQRLVNHFYKGYNERCTAAGVTDSDLLHECYFVIPTIAKYYSESDRQYKVTSFFRLPLYNAFRAAAGMRTKAQIKNPLNHCNSIDKPVPGTEDLTIGDTIEDTNAAETAETLIDNMSLSEVFPEAKAMLKDKPELYEVIYSVYHDNKTLEAVAKVTGKTPSRIRQQKSEALRRLRCHNDYLKSLYDDIIGRSYSRSSLSFFRSSGLSSVEWAVMELDRQKADITEPTQYREYSADMPRNSLKLVQCVQRATELNISYGELVASKGL